MLLWALTDHPRLGREARRRITSSSQVWVSSITVLELEIKASLGKLRKPADLDNYLATKGYSRLSFDHKHAAGVGRFKQLQGHDPFDRSLVAQASTEGLVLLTADRTLLELCPQVTADATL